MKKIKFYIIFLLFFPFLVYAQEGSCGLEGTEGQSLAITNFNGIKFFDETYDCDPITLKCNFVIIRRDNGTGNLPPESPFWTEWQNLMNNNLANITDPLSCSTGYPLDSKVRVKFDVYTIDNTAAWDWYAEANADNWPSSKSPNSRYICPRFDGTWDALEQAMDEFENNHFGDINFFFIDNGELVNLLEEHMANGTEPTEAYVDRFRKYVIDNPGCYGCSGLASGCSYFPNSFYSTASDNSYVISHFYSQYLIRNYFHQIFFPPFADELPETVWGWFWLDAPIMFLHEMGHNIINMIHDNSCNQLMSTYYERSNYIPKNRLEAIHRNLSTTDLHNAVDCNLLTENICPIQVISNTTLDQPMSVFGDLIIKSGVTLTVKSEVFLSEESTIDLEANAKLIVDGGKLTSGCGES
ncbi:MAG: hypothetical protein R2771_03080 [Saprospiraceae bacterium]